MKLKLISLALASSLILTACNSGSNSAQTVAVQQQPRNVVAVSSSGSEIAQNFIVNVLSGVIGSGGNPFVIAGTIFVSGLSAIFEWGSEDETGKMLAQMDGKLDTILSGMKDQFNTLGDIYSELHSFYVNSMSSDLSNSLTIVDADIDTITTKYTQYKTKTMFENVTFDNVGSLYEVAAKNCDEDYQSVLDSANSSQKSLLGNVSNQNKVDDMFSSFATSYADESTTYDSGSFYVRYQKNRNAYLNAALSKLPTNGDIMQYINYYNYENLNYAFQIAGSLQKLYNMQAVQLAYQYACPSKFNISFDNLPKLPKTDQGRSGYLDALKLLDKIYASAADKLKLNLQTYFTPVSNKDVYTLVNGTLFNNNPGLLESATFNSNGDGVGNCGINELKLKELRPYQGSQEGRGVGVASIEFSCLTNKMSTNIYESKNFIVETPYATTSAKQIEAYEVSQIGYDVEKKDIKYRVDQSTITYNDPEDRNSDMWQFSRVFSTGYVMENTTPYMLINASHYNVGGFFYGAYQINGMNGVFFGKNVFYNRYKADDAIWNLMPTQSNISADGTQLGSYQNNASAYSYEYRDPTTSTTMVSNPELYFAHYNGKVFLMKILSDYYPNAVSYNPHQLNDYVLRAATLNCLSDDCVATYTDSGDSNSIKAALEGNVVLKWADGTKVSMDHSGGLPTYADVSITNISGSKSGAAN